MRREFIGDLRRSSVQYVEWPALDRQLFEHGITPADVFDRQPRPSANLRETTHSKIVVGYSRWLGYLKFTGELAPEIEPDDRVTRVRLQQYFDLMRELGNRPYTILWYFTKLKQALSAMYPSSDFSWILAPGGVPLRSCLTLESQEVLVPGIRELYQWGCDLMDSARPVDRDLRCAVQYRDGLLIAMLATRARRIRSMAALRIGHEIVRSGDVYGLVLTRDLVKTKRPDAVHFPNGLTEYIETYLMVVRRELLSGQQHQWFWVSNEGGQLALASLQDVVQRRSVERFGRAFGPHRFRHALQTAVASTSGGTPGLGAAVLSISLATAQAHYNRASQDVAARKYQEIISAERTKGMTQDKPRSKT